MLLRGPAAAAGRRGCSTSAPATPAPQQRLLQRAAAARGRRRCVLASAQARSRGALSRTALAACPPPAHRVAPLPSFVTHRGERQRERPLSPALLRASPHAAAIAAASALSPLSSLGTPAASAAPASALHARAIARRAPPTAAPVLTK